MLDITLSIQRNIRVNVWVSILLLHSLEVSLDITILAYNAMALFGVTRNSCAMGINQGPVVQSIVSLTSSLRGQLVKCFRLYNQTH